MTTPPNPPERAPDIETQAAGWLARQDRGLTPAEQDEFFQWLADDPRHGEQLAQQRRTVAGLRLLAQWRPEHGAKPNPDLLAAPRPHPGRSRPVLRWAVPLALAAGAALAFLVGRQPAGTSAAVASAEPASLRKVLEDGSSIDLAPGADVVVSYSTERRKVRLVRGEATFKVAKNPARPFVVDAGGIEVRAVGTAFNVNLQAAQVAVLVTEGRVAVAAPGGAVLAAPAEVFLDAGQQTRVALAGTAAPVVEPAPAGEITRLQAWQPRELEFNDTPLAQVVAEFNSSNRVKLVIDDLQLASLPVGASLHSDNVDGFVRLLEASFRVQAERRADGVIVLRRAE
jgi:transmembrane sensor